MQERDDWLVKEKMIKLIYHVISIWLFLFICYVNLNRIYIYLFKKDWLPIYFKKKFSYIIVKPYKVKLP